MSNTDNNTYIFLYHTDNAIKTIADFISVEKLYNITADKFFDLNKELIFQQYTFSDLKEESKRSGTFVTSADQLTVDSILPAPPCKLKILPSQVTAQLAIDLTNLVEDGDFNVFANEKIQAIYQDEGYVQDTVSKRGANCSVFGWFKSKYPFDDTLDDTDSGIEDISNYIISLSTNVGENGGSFVLTLPAIGCSEATVSVTDEELNVYKKLAKRVYIDKLGTHRGNFTAKTDFSEADNSYFNYLISTNDLLFISFESLIMEKREEYAVYFDFESAIQNNVFDMIALVDSVRVITDAQSSNVYIEVSGRDLMKLLIDDGSFFFETSTSADPSKVFANDQDYNVAQGDVASIINNTYLNPIDRVRGYAGSVNLIRDRTNTKMEWMLKAVIQKLANVEIVPSAIFETWGDDRTKYTDIEVVDETKS